MQLSSASGPDIGIQVGEGGAPTWETAGTYINSLSGLNSGSTTLVTRNSTTENYMPINVGALVLNSSVHINFSVDLAALTLGSTKMFSISSVYPIAGQLESARGLGAWAGDTGAITSIRVVPVNTGSGTIVGTIAQGTCSLYGLAQ
jgi:hypothetical protein